MFDLDGFNFGKIHTEEIEKIARCSMLLNRCILARQSGSRRLKEVRGNLLIMTDTCLKAQAYRQPEASSSPAWLITQ